MSYQQLFVLL